MTVLCIFDSLVNTQRLWYCDRVITFRTVPHVNHLVKRVRISPGMNQRLHVILVHVMQVKLSDIIYLTSVFTHC